MINLYKPFENFFKKEETAEEKPFYLLDSSMKVQKISAHHFQTLAIKALKCSACSFVVAKMVKFFRFKEVESVLHLVTVTFLASFFISGGCFIHISRMEKKTSINDSDIDVFDSPIDCQL